MPPPEPGASALFGHAAEGLVHPPDYYGGGITNLLASLCRAMGGGETGYPGLSGFDPQRLARARHIVLLVIDGLGYDYLCSAGAGSLMASHCRARLTSVCPSTTTTAIPLFLTGLPPQQHGFTGWFTYFSELGSVLAVLPFRARLGGASLETVLQPTDLSAVTPLSGRIAWPSRQLMPQWIADSCFNRSYSGASRIGAFADLAGLRRALKRALWRANGQSYSYLYWPEFDSLAHHYGVQSREVALHFAELDALFGQLKEDLRGSDTLLLVTADHGFIDTTPQRTISLQNHPELQRMLMTPLCGEPRFAFSYIHPRRQRDFEQYAAERFAEQLWLLPSEQLLEAGWFGLGEPHPRLHQRIGHYALVMKENWTIIGTLPGERAPGHIGVHGGVSAAEMHVPLIYAEC
ncbi:MAG: alkaline phosphatase family protein [Gammaproteobacteria bacterium]|nr:alkaline phosphatase family protein [Gammaproteobacteria bacterium]